MTLRTATSYLGLRLPHPFIAGASPLGHTVDSVKRLEDAGAAAVVLHSLFEEQITLARDGRIRHMDSADPECARLLAEFPQPTDYVTGPDAYAEHLVRVKRAVSIPVIGSLNGGLTESWLRFARTIEQAGADGLELNLYQVIAHASVPGVMVENHLSSVVRELKRILTIPVAVKLSPFFTSPANVAQQLDAAGADALVLFNRFYQPDIDIETMRLQPNVELSTSVELRLRLHWLAILFGRVRPALALTGGVSTPDDGVKAILAGADVVQMVSALLRHGPEYIGSMRQGLEDWMESHQMTDLEEARGRASLHHSPDAEAFERANYIRTLQSWGRSEARTQS
jgi:dihydroorotate dehydrogenase (fumarate)